MSKELRLVYVVTEECDNEYGCHEVVFVTANEEYAKQYCLKHNVPYVSWSGHERDTVTYKEYPVLVDEVIASNNDE